MITRQGLNASWGMVVGRLSGIGVERRSRVGPPALKVLLISHLSVQQRMKSTSVGKQTTILLIDKRR